MVVIQQRKGMDADYLRHMDVITDFYSAFARKDWATMAAYYRDDATFSDPAFPNLNATEVRAMWKMLLSSGSDLRMTFKVIDRSERSAVCEWEAHYTFSTTGRAVHNRIRSEFELRDGLIQRQRDQFNFWRWSRQALGVSGYLLGWSPFLKQKVQGVARARLEKAMRS
jgi:ketosteroid isomerase-like protein